MQSIAQQRFLLIAAVVGAFCNRISEDADHTHAEDQSSQRCDEKLNDLATIEGEIHWQSLLLANTFRLVEKKRKKKKNMLPSISPNFA